MFFYNLKSAFRYFLKQKVFVGINLLGLVIAFAVSSLIMLYVINELKYDNQHKNARRIYRVLNNMESTGTTDALTMLDLGPQIKKSMPEVEKMSRMARTGKPLLVTKDNEIEIKPLFVDPDFVEMFTLKGKEKVSPELLSNPNSVLITQKLAKKVFGNQYYENLPFVFLIALLVILTAGISGFLTSASTVKMTPVSLLKKENTKLRAGNNLNKLLLTGQMVVVIWFLAVAFLIFKQLNFAQTKGLGYNPKNLITASIEVPREIRGDFDMYNPKYENSEKLDDFRTQLINHPAIKSTAIINDAPPRGDQLGSGEIKVKGSVEPLRIASISGTANFPEFMGYQIKLGNFFSKNYNKGNVEIILNEAAVKTLGLENPVGVEVSMDGTPRATIVGVVYDFNFQSMRKEIVPVRLRKTNNFLFRYDILLRCSPGSENDAIAHFNKTFNRMYKGYLHNIQFHEEQIEALYENEKTEARVIVLCIILAVFISVMGIFGISLFSIRQKVKEIGVRKINGARTQSILAMINLNIARWVAVAFIIATPLAWLSMNKWLENFAYKTTLNWWIFALAGVLALGIALLTVSWQSWRAATRNPVEALRYE